MIHIYETKVGYSEIGQNGRMTIGAMIDRMQDSSNFHSQEIGDGFEELGKKGRAWLLNSWQIVFCKSLKMGDLMKVTSWAHGYDKMFGYRDYMILDEDGEPCVKATTRWILIDVEKQRIMRIHPSDIEMYGMEEKMEMETAPRKIKIPDNLNTVDEIKVRGYHIDTNCHMNNSWYAKIACDYYTEDKEVKQMFIEYKKAAVKDDVIKVKIAKNEDVETVVLTDLQDNIYCIVEAHMS